MTVEENEPETPLVGGHASGDVIRIGETVRKPWSSSSADVFAYMAAVRAAGVDVPAALGRDVEGRQITEFIPGTLALEAPPLSLRELARVGRIVRSIHDASVPFTPRQGARWDIAIPAPGADLICHNDLAPWNLILGERWVFIDWDGACPSTREWDLAYAAQTFTLNDPVQEPAEAARRLIAFIDGYAPSPPLRRRLPRAMTRRTASMLELLEVSHREGREPWASMFVEGHGDHWRAVSSYVRTHESAWAHALRWAPGAVT